MYAVIEQGGKQYKVAQGDALDIELTEVAPDAKTIELSKVLLVSDGKDVKIGTPYLKGAKVIASFKTSAEKAVVKGEKFNPRISADAKTTTRALATARNTSALQSTKSKSKNLTTKTQGPGFPGLFFYFFLLPFYFFSLSLLVLDFEFW